MIKKWFSSKKFVATVAGIAVVICNTTFGCNIPEEQIYSVIGGIAMFCLGQGVADGLSKGATSATTEDSGTGS